MRNRATPTAELDMTVVLTLSDAEARTLRDALGELPAGPTDDIFIELDAVVSKLPDLAK